MKFRKIKGFTLAEMMVVMLIATIILAAMAPVMTSRIKSEQAASSDSPWQWGNNKDFTYFSVNDDRAVIIGQNEKDPDTDNARLVINRKDGSTDNFILFKHNGNALGRLRIGNTSITLGDTTKNGTNITSLGIGALTSNTGSNNTAVGAKVMSANTTGGYNTAVGAQAMSDNTTGGYNTAVGYLAMNKADTGSYNIGIGNLALYNSKGSNNIAIGRNTGKVLNSDSKYNIILGDYEDGVEKGLANILMGNETMSKGSGSEAILNIAIGQEALNGISKGAHNIAIGAQANIPCNKNVFDSYYSYLCRDSDRDKQLVGTIAIGNGSMATKAGSIAIGSSFPNFSSSCGFGDTCDNLYYNEVFSEYADDPFFHPAGWGGYKNVLTKVYTSSKRNPYFRWEIPASATGVKSIAIGNQAQATDFGSIAIGYFSIATGGTYSTAIGNSTSAKGNYSVAIGYGASALALNTVAIGGSKCEKANHICIGKDGNTSDSGINDTNERIIIGSVSSATHVGNLVYAGALQQSDRRLKNVGAEFTSGLDKIKQLKVFNYTFKDDKKKTPRVGVIAQDLQKIFPNAVSDGGNGYLTIRQEDMFYSAINAIKELDAKITAIVQDILSFKTVLQKVQDELMKVKSDLYAKDKVLKQVQRDLKTIQSENKQIISENKKLRNENVQLKARLDRIEAKLK